MRRFKTNDKNIKTLALPSITFIPNEPCPLKKGFNTFTKSINPGKPAKFTEVDRFCQ